MKAPSLVVVALVAVAFAGVAQAGPLSPLYLTTYVVTVTDIEVVQGNSIIRTFPDAYGTDEIPIAVYGDVRTAGPCCGLSGGQYTLAGNPTGTSYVLPSVITPEGAYDSTSDGSHNYLVDFGTGTVYQTARDYTNAAPLFKAFASGIAITYDAANNSLWISGLNNGTVADYSLSGGLLSSFSPGSAGTEYGPLALDPADHTLWLVADNYNSATFGTLEQYSTAGALLSTGPQTLYAYALGGEFNLAPTTPEPGTLILFGSGILGLAGVLRRKINL